MKHYFLTTKYTLLVCTIIALSACKKSPHPIPEEETLNTPIIKFYPESGNVGDTIWIEGKNFSKIAKNNVVTFHNAKATSIQSKINSAANDSLQVIVPAGASSDVLNLTILSKSVVARDTFWITTGKWIRKADLPSGGRFSGTAFGIGAKGYVTLGFGYGGENSYLLKDLWEFDPAQNQWTKKADFPVGSRMDCISFVIDNIAYVGLGSHSSTDALDRAIFAYNPVQNKWIQKAGPPIGPTYDVLGLAAAGKGYTIAGIATKWFSSFDPASNQWSVKTNFPGAGRSFASGFVINDELYVGAGNSDLSSPLADLWKYSPVTDHWARLADTFWGGYSAVGFALKGKGYRLITNPGTKRGSGFYEYDPVKNTWSMKKAFPGIALGNQMGFVANDRAFVTCGLLNGGYSAETWEFIP